jgi:hypothetical protein
MEYLLVVLKDAGEGLASSLRDVFDAGRVWLRIIIGIGVAVFLLWMLGRARRTGP